MTKIARKRHIIKSLTWRVVATILTVILVWIFTGDFELSLKFGAIEVILKLAAYYAHERVWYKHSKFGVRDE